MPVMAWAACQALLPAPSYFTPDVHTEPDASWMHPVVKERQHLKTQKDLPFSMP